MGLFEAGAPSRRPGGGRFELLGSAPHRAIAREAVRKSLVLLKDENGLLPLSPSKRVLVAGDGADNLAKQSGGWTLTWQGAGLDNNLFPGATSIWKGIQNAVTAAGGTAELSVEGAYTTRPDVAIVVFGENPYAEFQGDLTLLRLREGNDAHLALIRKLRAQNIPVVSVFLSGRPLWMNREINASNAFVAAWLPGSEGAGIADVLYRKKDGSIAYDFTGRLSFSWPRTVLHDPLKTGQPGYDPLFPLGHGLRYTDNGNLPPVSEEPGADIDSSQAGIFFSAGKLAPPWMLQFDSREAFDFSRETNGDVMLVMTVRVTRPPTAGVNLAMECGQRCAGTVALGAALSGAPASNWRRLGVPLKCFGQAGADMKQIRTALSLRTSGTLDLAIQRVALGTEADQKVACMN